MSDIFISHVEEDEKIATQIADELEKAGYTTWLFERDSIPGPKHLIQTRAQILKCKAIILVISKGAILSHEVETEGECGHDNQKAIIPILHGLPYAEFVRSESILVQIVGMRVTIKVPTEGVVSIIPRVIRGLKELGVYPQSIRLGVTGIESPNQTSFMAREDTVTNGKGYGMDLGTTALNFNGWTSYEKGDYYVAIDCFTKAIEIDPGFAVAWSNRGRAYRKIGDLDKALADYSKALDLAPNEASFLNFRGWARYEKGNHEEAIADLTKAIEIDPNYALAYSNRARVYYEKRDYDNAIKDSTKAIEIAPRFARAYASRGRAYRKKGDYNQALTDYSKAINLAPDEAAFYNYRGWAHYEREYWDLAIIDFTQAIKIDPLYALAHNNRARAYRAKGDNEKADLDFTRAAEIDPSYVAPVKGKVKDPTEPISITSEFVAKFPDPKKGILIAIGYSVMPQAFDMIPALRLHSEINRLGDVHQSKRACIVTDAGLLEAKEYSNSPLISIGGPVVNKITAALKNQLPDDPISTKHVKIQHDMNNGVTRVALWGSGSIECARAVDLFISSGLLNTFLKMLWEPADFGPSSSP